VKEKAMKVVLSIILAVLLITAPLAALAAGANVGDKAPVFEMQSTMGTISLSDYRGEKNVLLAFYYKDFTGG
jgi:hypothetical protein